jgi:hypothetical protein
MASANSALPRRIIKVRAGPRGPRAPGDRIYRAHPREGWGVPPPRHSFHKHVFNPSGGWERERVRGPEDIPLRHADAVDAGSGRILTRPAFHWYMACRACRTRCVTRSPHRRVPRVDRSHATLQSLFLSMLTKSGPLPALRTTNARVSWVVR